MPDRTRSKRANRQNAARKKKQQVIVVLLLIGLLVAIMTQPDPAEDPKPARRPAATPTSLSLNSAPAVTAANGATAIDLRWVEVQTKSRMKANEIAKYELFAAESDRQRVRKRVRNIQPVQAIYGNAKDHSALIGESIIHSGQPLPSGQKVLEITSDGVQIAP